MDKKPVHLDDVLDSLGSFGRHQIVTLAMIALVYGTNAMYNINYVFVVDYDVGYRCKTPVDCGSSTNGSLFWTNGSSFSNPVKQCEKYSEDSCQEVSSNNSVSSPCTEWVYEDENSFIAELDLACQDWKPGLIGSVHSFGNMLGLVVQGQICDRFGRKVAAVFAGTMGAVLGLVKSFANSFWVYIVVECLEAAVGDALSPIFMLSIELVPKKHIVLFHMMLLNCSTIGLIIMSFIAWAVPYWRYFLRIIYAPTLIILTYSYFLDESIRWLFTKGKRAKAVKIIEKIAKKNKVDIDKSLLNQLDYAEDEEEQPKFTELLIKTFMSKIMLKRFLTCSVWWFTITLINYGMMVSSVLFEGNKYLNFALLMIMDIPANVFYWVALHKYKRKLPLIVSFSLGGVFCIAQPFLPNGYRWLSLVLLMSFECLATFSYNAVYMYTSELFPTATRASQYALCSAVGRAGALLAPPLTPMLNAYWPGLPVFIFGVTSLICGLLTLGMPETAHVELPDTLRQAERLGEEQGQEMQQMMSG